MAEVRVGVLGLGFMGSRWARALAEHPAARLTVVADVREELGRETAARYGASFVKDPMEAATHHQVDGVAICTPEQLHVEPSLAALSAGKAVMVEKPLAHTVEDAERIRKRSAETDAPILVGHILRFEPRYAAMHRAVEEGRIGAVQAIRSERIGLVSDQDVLGGRTSIALYYGVHELDLARWYAGEVTEIWAARSSGVLQELGFPIDDLYSVGLRFADGGHGTSMVGWSLPRGMPGWGMGGFAVFGEQGVLRVSQMETGLLGVGPHGPFDMDVYYSSEVHGAMWGALAIEADHFVRCVTGSAVPICTAADGAEAVRLSLAMEEAAATGHVVGMRPHPPNGGGG